MSWALKVAGDAISDLQLLDVMVQEAVLDEIEVLLEHPDLIAAPIPQFGSYHHLSTFVDDELQIVVLRLNPDAGRQLLTVLGIQRYIRA